MKDFAKIEELCHSALQLPLDKREAFLRDSCGDDLELLKEVQSLLLFEENAADFIETPPDDIAAMFFADQNTRELSGKNLLQYKILEPLGKGGMGEVYLADDTKLGRKVALKILPPQFSEDEARLNLFEQEARAISTLNHPNIITIYNVEEFESLNFIATEFIEGKTLREMISEKTFNAQETIEIIIQVADALESAHSVGIIHRDIKPANIMIRKDGLIKVLDFGLAKIVISEDLEVMSRGNNSNSPLVTSDIPAHQTNAGVIMGTLNYMSPEQLQGNPLDARTDIFSLGVVMYEMLSGEQPFAGNSDSAIYSATLKGLPKPLRELNPKVPTELEKIVKKALDKDANNRYQTAKDLRNDLRRLKDNKNNSAFQTKLFFPLAAVFFLILLGIGAYLYFFNRPNVIPAFTYTQLTSQNGEELFPNLSPDGKSFLYSSRESGNWDVYLKQINGSGQINLTKNSTADEKQAVFSPDGNQIAFRSERNGGGIFVMNLDGKNVKQITDSGFYPNWSPDGKEIVYCLDNFSTPGERPTFPSELWRVGIESGEKYLITKSDAVQPSWSPNGKRIAFWGLKEGTQRDIFTVSADGGEAIAVTDDAATDWNPFWSLDGKFLYFVSNRSGSMNLWRVAIDENSGKLLKSPEAITIPTNYSQFLSFGRNGNFIYSQAAIDFNLWQVGFNSETETVDKKPIQITNDSLIKTDPNVSPDDKSLLFASVGSLNEDIYLANADGSGIHLLTETPFKERMPVWSPDGKRLAFISNRSGGDYEGWLINPDGSNLRKITPSSPEISTMIPVWSPDGKSLLFSISNNFPLIFDPDKNLEEQTPIQLPPDKGKNSYMATSWSPDGKKIAGYTSLPNGTIEPITVYDFNTQQYRDLTDFGGGLPLWLKDSRRLIFCYEDKIFLLDTETKKLKELLSVKPSVIDSISISKDSRFIYYTVRKKEADIWVANTQ